MGVMAEESVQGCHDCHGRCHTRDCASFGFCGYQSLCRQRDMVRTEAGGSQGTPLKKSGAMFTAPLNVTCCLPASYMVKIVCGDWRHRPA